MSRRYAHQLGLDMEVNVAVVTVDLASPPREISGLGSCRRAHILFTYRDQPICRREADVIDGTITRTELVMAMKERDEEGRANQNAWDTWAEEVLKDHLGIGSEDCSEALPPCTVLVCTRDRPSDLRRCLTALCANVSEEVEIIVVDNDPPDEQARF